MSSCLDILIDIYEYIDDNDTRRDFFLCIMMSDFLREEFARQKCDILIKIMHKYNCFKNIKYIKNQYHKLCLRALHSEQNDGTMMAYIRNQTPLLCHYALSINNDNTVRTFKYIKDKSKDITISALTYNAKVLKYVHPQTEEMVQIAITYAPKAILYVKNPTHEIYIKAIKIDPTVLKYIKYIIPGASNEKKSYYELCSTAVHCNGNSIQHVMRESLMDRTKTNKSKRPKYSGINETEYIKLCMYAIQRDGTNIQYIKGPTFEMYLLAVKSNGFALKQIPKYVISDNKDIIDPSYIVLASYAVRENWKAFKYCIAEAQTYELCIIGVTECWKALEFVKDEQKISHPDICICALKKNCLAIKFIPDEILVNIKSAITDDNKTNNKSGDQLDFKSDDDTSGDESESGEEDSDGGLDEDSDEESDSDEKIPTRRKKRSITSYWS